MNIIQDKISVKDFHAAVLDMDGTILDSMPCWETVGIRYLLDKNIEIPDIPALALRLKATTVPMAAEIYRQDYGITDSIEKITQDIHDMIADDYRFNAPLKPNAMQAIKRMKEHDIRICVATATDYNLAQQALSRVGVLDMLDFIASCQQLSTSKNQPYIFSYSSDRLNVPKNQTVVFDDSLHAVETAHNAGYRTIGVYDKSSEAEKTQIKALCEGFIYDWRQLSFA